MRLASKPLLAPVAPSVQPHFRRAHLVAPHVLPILFLGLALSPLVRANPAFDRWADAFAETWAESIPQLATASQYFTGARQDALDRQLVLMGDDGDIFGSHIERRVALARRGLEELGRFPRDALTMPQRVSRDLIEWALQDEIAGSAFRRVRFVFTQETGAHLGLVNFLSNQHPVRNSRDIENYLARLDRVAPLLDEGIDEARAAAAEGYVPPRFILERTLEQIDEFLRPEARANALVASLAARIVALGEAVTPAARERFLAAAEIAVRSQIRPVFTRIRELLAGQLPQSTHEAGLWRLPNGPAAYCHALASFTTTSMTADEIHLLGLREVARIEREMDVCLRQVGYAEGSIQDRLVKLSRAVQPPTSPDPRPRLLRENLRIVRDAERRCAELFSLVPRAFVEVRREPPASEFTASAHYQDPAPDGSLPGIYWLPLPGPEFPILDMRTTAYHETVPGHHFQLALQQESTELPRFRKLGVFGFISGYGEGWALYAERLADEQGWYEGDPRGRLGYLSMQLLRARRMVVDTGIHAKRWTRQQAIDYGVSAGQIERYVAWGGQACSYMVGQLRIVELREQARTKLGPKFSLKEFHAAVLRPGNVPLSILTDEINAWVVSRQAGR